MMHPNITIGFFDYEYKSHDGGQTWHASERTLSTEYSPVLMGDAELGHFSFFSDRTKWRFIYYRQDKAAGVAVDSCADLFVTSHRGGEWQKILDYRFSVFDRLQMALLMCWPPETFDCMIVSQDFGIFLCWEDPWIMSGSKTHLIYAGEDMKFWRYRCLGDAYPWLNLSPAGQVVICAENHLWIGSGESRIWRKERLSIDWGDRDQKGLCWSPFQRIGFLTETQAYAITPIWIEGANNDIPENMIAVLKTEDGCKHWHKVAILGVPKSSNHGNHNIDDLISIRFE